jgi:glycosyltransferase involved in cell wall biosynthesis
MTVSASTKADLLRLKFTGSISIIPEGIEQIAHQQISKSTKPAFLYVGRLAPSKRVEDIIKAFAGFRRKVGVGNLRIVGSGSTSYQNSLVLLARTLGVQQHVAFCGRVSTLEKHRLMAEAHALLMTSVREGWGLVISEANACGTPAIVYDVPGLHDSVRHEVTGLVVPQQPEKLSDAMVRLTTDSDLYGRLVAAGRGLSMSLSYDGAAQAARLAILAAVR